MNLNDYKILIVGNGRLALTFKKKLPQSLILSRTFVDGLLKNKNHKYLEHEFGDKILLLNTAAITDPNSDRSIIDEINYQRACRIHQKLTYKSLFISFGTITEKSNISNGYVDSKRRLSEYLLKCTNAYHFRLHTLYGMGTPIPHMFLGQMLQSLKSNRIFKMSSGMQFREYQNINYVVDEIVFRMNNYTNNPDITFGHPYRLREIAIFIMKHFRKGENLIIDNSIINDDDIYDQNLYLRNTHIVHPRVLKDISKYLEKFV